MSATGSNYVVKADVPSDRKAFNVGTSLETEVLHGISLKKYRGDFCAVMGPSDSGKRTLMYGIGLAR